MRARPLHRGGASRSPMRSTACWRRPGSAPACPRTSRPCDDPTVTLPDTLQAGIDEVVGAGNRSELERDARSLSDTYRAGGSPAARAARSKGDVAAYLATRAPATYAA